MSTPAPHPARANTSTPIRARKTEVISALPRGSGVEDREEDQDPDRKDRNPGRPADKPVKGLFLFLGIHRSVLVFSHLRHPLQMFSRRYPICPTLSPVPSAQCVAVHSDCSSSAASSNPIRRGGTSSRGIGNARSATLSCDTCWINCIRPPDASVP